MPRSPALALIVAGGRGSRAGEGLPKQYRRIGGVPVIRQTVEAFLHRPRIDAVQIVVHPDDRELCAEALAGLALPTPVDGGATRQDSVRRGLEALLSGHSGDALVLIHDAARPFVTRELIDRCLDAAEAQRSEQREPAVVPALPVTDSLRRGGAHLVEAVDRSDLLRVQTPQCFRLATIAAAHAALDDGGDVFTDDAAMMMEAGHDVAVVDGDERNMKLTSPDDFARAEALLETRRSVRTGFGFDVHAFEEGDHVWIGGVRIDHDRALKGHSDADVGLHAVTDALLGALAAGDIGDHFPPSGPQWRGAPSSLFLDHARTLADARGARVEHADLTIICEAPRIGPHKDAIRQRIADLLRLGADRVSVKATTTERLGFTGRGEGIAAQAVVTVSIEDGRT